MRIFVDASLLIYLNLPLPESEASLVEDFWLELLDKHHLYTNVLVFDELLYISKKKYSVPHSETLEFIERAILPYVDILTLGLREYMEARRFIARHGLPPSDAVHAATAVINNLDAIAS